MNLLATHASAQDDECGGICGTDADCVVNDLGTGVCQCKDGSTFNDVDYTCDDVVDECGGICGTDADCVVNDLGTGVCQCKDGSTFNDVDHTCDGVVDPCASWDCSRKGDICQVSGDGSPECYAPLLQTTVQLQLQVKENGRPRSYPENVKFTTNGPAAQASGDTACTDLTSSFSLRGDTQISIQWQSYGLQGAGDGMCKSVSFFSNPGCTGNPGLKIPRPAKDGGSYRNTDRTAKATDLPKSVGCEITTCHKDCGTAECVVEGGQPQCHCPWGFTFNEAEKICSDKTFNPADNSCKTGTLKCDKNSMCVVKNGQGMCQCNGGYTKTNGLCTAMCKPACPAQAQCTVVGGNAKCQCKAGFKMDQGTRQCTPACSPACPDNAQCKTWLGKALCQCKQGFKMDKIKNKCTPKYPATCPDNAQCKMVQGTPQCQCKQGFKMDKSKNKCT
ncbi:unnamed protein product, partial [Closterium sp. Yama58-4]